MRTRFSASSPDESPSDVSVIVSSAALRARFRLLLVRANTAILSLSSRFPRSNLFVLFAAVVLSVVEKNEVKPSESASEADR